MAKTKKNNEILFSRRLQLAITIGALFVALANVWIITKLSPLSKDIALNAQQIHAATQDIEAIRNDHEHLADKDDIESLSNRLGRIEGILLAR
jgi:hypothetical protein